MRVVRGSETMLLVELEPRVDPRINQQAIDVAVRLRDRHLRGVRDVVPAYCSVGVHFDPLSTDLVALERAIADDAAGTEAPGEGGPAAQGVDGSVATVVEIPVRYGGDEGPDLAAVAAWAGCSPEDVIERHAGREYRVYMLGFVGGFSYMGTVDPSIAAPRHRTPRERVPVGSVGIAGAQTGVYPLTTPGGWQIVGRTDVKMFDVARTPPNLLAPGDLVRFVPVARAR
jgi:KipI family sensor histidine kinase inhibitor